MTRWRTNSRQAAKNAKPQSLPFSAWILYRIRFISTADVCGAWSSFGGLAAQLNHLSIVLHIATTETIGTALVYDSLLSSHLDELARSRAGRVGDAVDFASLLSNEHHRFKIQAATQTAKPPPAEKGKDKGKGRKKKKETWLPKKEYLAKLEAERKAKADAAAASSAKRSRSPSRRGRPPSPNRHRSKRRSFHRSPRKSPPKKQAMKRQQRR